MVGRQRELSVLRDGLAQVKAGRGQVVFIVGEAGLGKSRLLQEFKQGLADWDLDYRESHCLASDRLRSLSPFIEHLRRAFRFEEQDDDQDRRGKIEAKLRQAGIHVEAWFPLLAHLFSLPMATGVLQRMEPKLLRERTFHAMRLLTTQDSRVRPLVLVVEDLHRADPTSLEYLPFLIDGLGASRVLLLLTSRPEFTPAWGERPHHTTLALPPLTPSESGEMVTALLGVDRAPAGLGEWMAAKSEGVPFFIEELAKSLVESGLLVRTNGTYALKGDPKTLRVPTTIQEILRDRLDRLPTEVRRTLQVGAVVGQTFPLRLLATVSGLTEEMLGRHIEQLAQRGLLAQQGAPPELEGVFTNALIQEVAYESIEGEERQALHLTTGQAIEALARDRLEEPTATLAFHYGRSSQPECAIEPALRAGDKAASLFSNSEATAHYDQALTILRSLPSTPRHQALQIDAMVKLASVAVTREHFERDLANLETAATLVQGLNDQRRTEQVLYWTARTHYVRGDMKNAVEFAEKSLAVAEPLQDESLIVWPVNLMGRIYLVTGDFLKAKPMLQRCVELLERLRNWSELSTACSFLALALAVSGKFEEGLELSARGLHFAREMKHLPTEAASHHFRALLHWQRGEWSEMVEACRAALEIAARIPDPFRVYLVTILLGYGLLKLGEAQRGIETLQKGIGLAEQLGTKFFLHWAFLWLSESYLAQNDPDAALNWASEALSLTGQGSDFWGESGACRSYAEALAHKDPARWAEAEEHMLRAIGLQKEKGMKSELARSYASYACLLRVKGAGEKAKELLDQARAMFQEMKMQCDLRAMQ